MNQPFAVQRDHAKLIASTFRVLEPGGLLIFSTHDRTFKMDGKALSGLKLEEISRQTIPRDFERNPKIHRCWQIAS